MISAMRRLAGTWFAKALFILLILSFAIWGIEDMVRNIGRDTSVARVGGEAIEAQEAQEATTRELQRITRALQGNFTPNATIRRAVAEQAVESLVIDRVARQEARRMGITVPDDTVRAYVFRIPGFQGLDGRFSRDSFNQFLRNNDLTESGFLALLRSDLSRQQLSGAVRSGAAAPEALAARILAWQLERRTASLVELEFAAAPEPEAPTEAQLARFHENNAARFSTPEFRDVAIATLNAERMIASIEVSERDIEDAYAANRDQYGAPERREVFQALLPTEEAAREVARLWREEGTEFPAVEAAAREAGGSATPLGSVTRTEMPLPALANAAFALAAGAVSDPVQTPFGWHVLRVGTVQPGETQPLEAVRDRIRATLAAERAADEAFDRATRVEDTLAGGATVAEAARRHELGFAEARIDAEGRAPDGTEVPLPVPAAARAAALRAIFAAERGAAPRFQEGEWGFMAVEVREVIPPALIPLDEVRQQVTEAFLADARRRYQEQRAAALLAALRAGRPMAEAAAEIGATPEVLGPFGREPGGGNPMPRELLAPVFELPVNGATMVERPRSFAVAQLLSIQPAELGEAAEALGTLRRELAQTMAEDLEAQYQAALRARSDVRINPRIVQQIAGGE